MVVLLVALTAGGTAAAPHKTRQENQVRKVWIGEARAEDGQVVVPLEVDDISDVMAIDLNLLFQSEQFTIVDVLRTNLLSGFFAIHNVDGDTLKIAIASASSNKGSGTFLEIVVEGEVAPEFGLLLVGFNSGDQIPVEYEKLEIEAEEPPIVTAVGEVKVVPPTFRLLQNFPNPFNAETTIAYSLPESARVELAIFNEKGQKVRTLVDGERSVGAHRIVWDGKNEEGQVAASGRYVAQLVADGKRKEIGMVLLK
jgi:hypothetical protein